MTRFCAPPFPILSNVQCDETSPSFRLRGCMTAMTYQSSPTTFSTINPNISAEPSTSRIPGTAALSNNVRLAGPAVQPMPSAPLETLKRSAPVPSETIASRGCQGGPSRPGPRCVLTDQDAGYEKEMCPSGNVKDFSAGWTGAAGATGGAGILGAGATGGAGILGAGATAVAGAVGV